MLKNGGLYVCKGTTFECLRTTEVERVDLEGTPSSEGPIPLPTSGMHVFVAQKLLSFVLEKK